MPTIELLEEKFNLFNKLIFKSALKPLPIRLSNAKSYYGMLKYKRTRSLFGKTTKTEFFMVFSIYFNLTEREIEDIVIHEMIHYYIDSNNIHDTSTHGKVFRELMQRINTNFGRNIKISDRRPTSTATQPAPRSRVTYFCVTRLRNGHTGFTAVAKTRIFKLWDIISRSPDVVDYKWYVSTSPYFAKQPRFQTPKVIYLPSDELTANLTDATPLEKLGPVIRPIQS